MSTRDNNNKNRPMGTVCAVFACKSRTSNKSISMFRFPKDPKRAMLWIEACNRKDLKSKSAIELYKNYKVCGLHFEKKCYLNDLQNRLQPHAIPTNLTILDSHDNNFSTLLPVQKEDVGELGLKGDDSDNSNIDSHRVPDSFRFMFITMQS